MSGETPNKIEVTHMCNRWAFNNELLYRQYEETFSPLGFSNVNCREGCSQQGVSPLIICMEIGYYSLFIRDYIKGAAI